MSYLPYKISYLLNKISYFYIDIGHTNKDRLDISVIVFKGPYNPIKKKKKKKKWRLSYGHLYVALCYVKCCVDFCVYNLLLLCF